MSGSPNNPWNPGDEYFATDANGIYSESDNLIQSSGQALNSSDNFQEGKAVAQYASVGDFYIEGGGSAANAYVIEGNSSFQEAFQLGDGMRIRFRVTNANTGASTLNLNGLGAKVIEYAGTALTSGLLSSGNIYQLIYIASTDKWAMEFNISGTSILFSDEINGRVGVGTKTPQSLLHMKSGGAATLRIEATSVSDDSKIEFYTDEVFRGSLISDTSESNAIRLLSSSGAGIDIDQSGNIGFGITAPIGSFHIKRGGGLAVRYETTSSLDDIANNYVRNNVLKGRIVVDQSESDEFKFENGSGQGIGIVASGFVNFNGRSTEDFSLNDAGSTGATEQDWIEVSVGGVTGYLRVFSSK